MASTWLSTRDGRTMEGPWTSKELKRLAATGQLLPSDSVRRVGAGKLMLARRVKGLFVPPAGQGG